MREKGAVRRGVWRRHQQLGGHSLGAIPRRTGRRYVPLSITPVRELAPRTLSPFSNNRARGRRKPRVCPSVQDNPANSKHSFASLGSRFPVQRQGQALVILGWRWASQWISGGRPAGDKTTSKSKRHQGDALRPSCRAAMESQRRFSPGSGERVWISRPTSAPHACRRCLKTLGLARELACYVHGKRDLTRVRCTATSTSKPRSSRSMW
jgi:hypothetical protein